MPTALTYTYCVEADVIDLLSQEGEELRLDDDGSGTISAAESARVTDAINYATARVNFFLAAYEPVDLNTSWQVFEWTRVLAARWLCMRRGNPVPSSIATLYDEALEDMERVRSGGAELADCGKRNVPWPTHSAIRVDHTYSVHKARVERPLSERTPTQGRQIRDRAADFIGPTEEAW